MKSLFVTLVAVAMLSMSSAVRAADEPAAGADWPTVQHDFQRTGYTPVCPEPPWVVRWVWCNGQRMDRTGVREDHFGLDKMPDFLTTRFVSFVQPMVWKGVSYVGSVEGMLFAIDNQTGDTKWRAKASGPILYSVSIADDMVFVPTMRGVDAFDLDGKLLWHFEDRRGNGFWSNPAYSKGTVLIGGLSGFFYGIDAKTGKEKWAFRAGGPVAHCPAVHEDSVYFCAEDLHAYSLDIATGRQNWKSEHLAGVTVKHHWPVIAAKEKALIIRTAGLGYCPLHNAAANEPKGDYMKTQEAMRKVAQEMPGFRTMFVLNLDDGKEKVLVASGYLSLDEVPVAPIVLTAPVKVASGETLTPGSVLSWHWSQGGAFQQGGKFSGYSSPVDFGRINFETGFFERIGPVASLAYPAIVRNDDFHYNTMGGQWLFGIQHGLGWGATRLDKKEVASAGGGIHYVFPAMGKVGHTWPGVRFALGFVAPTITNDLILMNPAKGVFFAALESKNK